LRAAAEREIVGQTVMRTTAQDEFANLEVLNLFISTSVRHVVEATLVIMASDHLFRRAQDLFAYNPANTLPYIALRALEEQSIVHIAEALKDEHKLHPVAADIRRKEDLFLHRDGVSHPLTVKWRKADRQAFFDSKRVHYDLRAALVWDMQRSINDVLRSGGRKVRNGDIVVTTHMALMVETILRLSLTEIGSQVAISTAEIPRLLDRTKNAFLSFVIEHPDGRRPGGARAAQQRVAVDGAAPRR
jgi:hypothetical protein